MMPTVQPKRESVSPEAFALDVARVSLHRFRCTIDRQLAAIAGQMEEARELIDSLPRHKRKAAAEKYLAAADSLLSALRHLVENGPTIGRYPELPFTLGGGHG